MPGLPLDRDRLSVVSGAILLALAFSRLLDLPVRRYEITVLGSPLGLTLSAGTILLLFVAALAATGMQSLLSGHPQLRGGLRHSFVYWILPVLLGTSLAGWLEGLVELGTWTLAMVAASVLVPLTLAQEYRVAAARAAQPVPPSPFWAEILIYPVGLIFFYTLAAAHLRILAAAPLIFIFTTLLVARMLWAELDDIELAFRYSPLIALIPVPFYWLLNYLPFSPLHHALLLLLVLDLATTLVEQWLAGRWERRFWIDYALFAVLYLLFIFFLAP